MNAANQPQPYSVRLPIEMRRQLEEAAGLAGRSLHAEILMRLEATLQLGNPDENWLKTLIRQTVREEMSILKGNKHES